MAGHYYSFASTLGALQTVLDNGFIGPMKVRYVPPVKGEPNLNNEPTYSTATEGRIFTFDYITATDFQHIYDISGGDSRPFAYGFVRAKKWGYETWWDWECMMIRPDRGDFWRNAGKDVVFEVREMKNPVAVA